MEKNQLLQENEGLFKFITKNSSDVIVVSDLSLNVIYLSPSAEQLLGEPIDRAKKYTIEDIYPPETVMKMKSMLQKELTNDHNENKNRFGTLESQLKRPDGKIRYVHLRAKFIRDNNGNPIAVQCAIRDITDIKNTLNDLETAKEELDRYFTSSLDLLCIANTDGRFIRLNPEWENVLGYTVEELEGKLFLDYLHPDDKQSTLDAIGKLSEQETILNFENRYLHKDGTYRWIEWRSKPLGKTIYAVARDITQRKKTEEYLRFQNSYQRLVSSIAGSFVAAGRYTLDKRIGEALQKISEFYEIDRSYLFIYSKITESLTLKHSWCDKEVESFEKDLQNIKAEDYPWFFKQLRKHPFFVFDIDNMPTEASSENKYGIKIGTKELLTFPLEVENKLLGAISFASVKNKKNWPQEDILRLGVIVKIVTEAVNRRRLEEKIGISEQQAAAMAMMVTTNHEIKQPLMIIQGYVEFLRIKISSSEFDKYLDGIETAVNRIKGILESLHAIKNIEYTDYVEGSNMVKIPENINNDENLDK